MPTLDTHTPIPIPLPVTQTAHPLFLRAVTIMWKNAEWDWHWYEVLDIAGGLIRLTGVSSHDGAPWTGSPFWAPVNDIELMYEGTRAVDFRDDGIEVIDDKPTVPEVPETINPGEEE